MAQPVRVLFVAGSLGGGGAERRLVDVLKHLDPTRIAPRLYLAYRRGELLAEVPEHVPIDAFSDGGSPRSFGQRWLAKLRCPSRARAWHLREVLAETPVDLLFSWSLLPSYEAALARRGLSIPQIAAVGVHPTAELDDAFTNHSLWARCRAAWTYRSADLILANSEELGRQFEAFYGLASSKVRPWLNTRDFARIDRLAAAETPPWPGSGRRIVAAGRLRPQKGFDVLLQAAAKIHSPSFPIQVAILGQGPAEHDLRRLAAELGIAGQVHFPGFQANPFAWFRTADVFALPSRFEGNPNTLIEAMACGVAVIAADCPTGPREILDDGRWGRLVPVDDVEALADALAHVLAHPPSKDDVRLARQSVLDRYGLGDGTDRLETLLRSVLAQSSR